MGYIGEFSKHIPLKKNEDINSVFTGREKEYRKEYNSKRRCGPGKYKINVEKTLYIVNKGIIRGLFISLYGKEETRKLLRRIGYYYDPYIDRKEYKKSRKEADHIYRENHKEYLIKHQMEEYYKNKSIIFGLLGDKCSVCGCKDVNILNIDHINGNGKDERLIYSNGPLGIIRKLKKEGWKKDYLKSQYQLLCYNHNLTKEGKRGYLDGDYSILTKPQKNRRELWTESLDFFGPCTICGESSLKYLSLDHINCDGKEERGCLGGDTESLLRKFRRLEWPEYLKESYQLLCFNCHFGKKTRIENRLRSFK
jgi:hypothetical protein